MIGTQRLKACAGVVATFALLSYACGGMELGSGSSSGSGSASGSVTGTSGGSGSASVTGPSPRIPAASGTCPTLAPGTTTVTVLGQKVVVSVGTKQANQKGSVFFYWHGTGDSSSESNMFFGPQTAEITSQGGIVASFTTSPKMGTDVGGSVWYTGDFAMADQILACAVQQLNIDTRRIYSGGCSTGGLMASRMLYDRSSYIAAVMPNSGGIQYEHESYPLQDPSHVPSLITTHGMTGTDVVIVDFSRTSLWQDEDVSSKGGFVVDCNHGGGHCGAPANDVAAQWQFCKDHPFGVSPEPYAGGLPSSFPSYCTIIRAGPPSNH